MESCAAGFVLAELLHCIQMVSRSAIPPRPRTEVRLSLVADVVMIDLLSHNPSNKTIPWCAKRYNFAWRIQRVCFGLNHSISEPSFADAEIRIGDDQLPSRSCARVRTTSSTIGTHDAELRRFVALRYCCEHNAIDAMCRNGCWVHGGRTWTRLSAKRSRTRKWLSRGEPGDQSIDKAAEPERECGFPRSGTVA